MTKAELLSMAGLLVAVFGACFNYFKLERAQRTEFWSASRQFARLAWRALNAVLVVFFVAWPLLGIWAFSAALGAPTRSEIVTLCLNFINVLLWGSIAMKTLRDWLRAKKTASIESEGASEQPAKEPM